VVSNAAFDQVQIQNLQAACEASEQIRALAEGERGQALEALEEIARLFMPEALLAEGEHGKDKLTPAYLLELARRRAAWARLATNGGEAVARLQEQVDALKRDLAAAQQAQVVLEQQLETSQRANEEQAAQLEAAHGTIQGLQETTSGLRETVTQLRSQLNAQQVQVAPVHSQPEQLPLPGSVPVVVEPPPPDALTLLRAIGETGFFLRADLAQQTALGAARNSRFRKAIRGLLDLGWLEEIQPASEMTGRAPRLVRLTATGHTVFQEQFGREPEDSLYERLLRRHKSPEHVLLNWATAQELKRRDYLTDLFPQPFALDGGTVTPDLVASQDDRVYYIECERHTRKNKNSRPRKWDLYHKMTGGHFYLVVPNKTAQSALVSELSKWVYQTQRAIDLHLSNQTEWDTTGDFWTLEREIRRGGVLTGSR
jgi:hypothetical protein